MKLHISSLGQGKDLRKVEEKAWSLGVVNHYSIDAREEFINDYVVPAIKANALYMDAYPISSSLSRPLIASKLVEEAQKELSSLGIAHIAAEFPSQNFVAQSFYTKLKFRSYSSIYLREV